MSMVAVRLEGFVVDDEVRKLFHTITNELHANTQAVGRLAGDVGRLGERILTLEVRVGDMRGQLDSVPDQAEDTARHEVEKLKQELLRQEKEDLEEQLRARKDSVRVAADRRWLLFIAIIGPGAAALLSGIAVHLWHVLGK